MRLRISILILSITLFGCVSKKKNASNGPDSIGTSQALAHQYIYKQKYDFSEKLPVVLSEDKQLILAYPDPLDVSLDTLIRCPVKLFKDYWFDRIGIGVNTGYVDILLRDYARLAEPPRMEFMRSKLIEKEPFQEVWDCGIRGEITVNEVNELILQDSLIKRCKQIWP